MKWVTRKALGWPVSAAGTCDPRNGLVAHWNGPSTNLRTHQQCLAYWQSTRKFHMGANGWVDIGYSFGVCPHGYVFEGRGLKRQQAAQPGGNTTWYSCSWMIGANEKPTAAQVNAWLELRSWLMRGYHVKPSVWPHSSFISTDCPGPHIKSLISSGALTGDVKNVADLTPEQLWQADIIAAPPWELEKGNATWRPDTYLATSYVKLSEALDRIKALEVIIGKMAEKMGI